VFGFRDGESADTVARKKGHMEDARQQWRFLTNYDLTWIKTKRQLCLMVQTRSGISEEQARQEVDAWMAGKDFSADPAFGARNGEQQMTEASYVEATPPVCDNQDQEMAKYGIVKNSVDYFHYREYRYTKLSDAIAQAKRQHPAVPPDGRERSGLR
jgi:hypothetical protein